MATLLSPVRRSLAAPRLAYRSTTKPSLYSTVSALRPRPRARLRPPQLTTPRRTLTQCPSSLGRDMFGDLDGKMWYEKEVCYELEDDKDAKWGWVIYRTAYAPELEEHWEQIKRLLHGMWRKQRLHSDSPETFDKLDMKLVEDPALEGAHIEDLKRRWRAWVRSQVGLDLHDEEDVIKHGVLYSRHMYFIYIDEEALRGLSSNKKSWHKVTHNPNNPDWGLTLNGHVKFVSGWRDRSWDGWRFKGISEEEKEYYREEDWEDCVLLSPRDLDAHLYQDLMGPDEECWHGLWLTNSPRSL